MRLPAQVLLDQLQSTTWRQAFQYILSKSAFPNTGFVYPAFA